MFPLQTQTFPATSSELSALLNESLRRVFHVSRDPVTITGDCYPVLERIEANLDGAQLRPDLPRPPVVEGPWNAGVEVTQFGLDASELSLGPAKVNLRLSARDVRLEQALDANEEVVLALRSAAEGEIEISASKSDLEAGIAAFAKQEAGKQGIAIEKVTLLMQADGPRGVSGELQVQARKLFFSAVIRISGALALDQDLNATIFDLKCKGEGAIGTLACGVLSPHLQKLEGRTFPLMALPLGEIRLHDVRISIGEKITVNAEFGAGRDVI